VQNVCEVRVESSSDCQNKEDFKNQLRPGFTAINNAFWDSQLLASLTGGEIRLLLWFIRFTNGFLREFCFIGEENLIKYTKLSRTSLYEAKRVLEEKGLIQVVRTRRSCRYRLGEELQVLLKEEESTVYKQPPQRGQKPRQGTHEVRSNELHGSDLPDPWKEDKDINNQHHVSRATLTPSHDDVSFNLSLSTASENRYALAEQLKQFGVSEFMAYKLTRNHPEEVISLALGRLKQVTVTNPAGYLVSEILRGGYGQPVKDTTKATRLEHEKLHALRRNERQQEENAKEQSCAQVAALLQQFESLSANSQQALRLRLEAQAQQEGFARLPGWGQSHPLYRGLLAEIVQAQLSAQTENEPAHRS
jgi:hypothetical protein